MQQRTETDETAATAAPVTMETVLGLPLTPAEALAMSRTLRGLTTDEVLDLFVAWDRLAAVDFMLAYAAPYATAMDSKPEHLDPGTWLAELARRAIELRKL
jgi:hypothetical protein